MLKKTRHALVFGFMLLLGGVLTACSFHLRGDLPLAAPLHSVYIQSSDPYGVLVKELVQSFKMSGATLADSPAQAKTTLAILNESTGQELLSVSGTQQTRQYKLSVNVIFAVNDNIGRTIVAPQSLTESRVITVQSNQILGSSNEANLYFQQMRRTLASSIMYRLSSHEITQMVDSAYPPAKPTKKVTKKRS